MVNMSEDEEQLLGCINLILSINVNSLYTGEYCYKDTNLLKNIGLIRDIHKVYKYNLDKLELKKYYGKEYSFDYLSFVDVLDRVLEYFKYLDDITDNKYNFVKEFNDVISNGTLNLEYDSDGSTCTYKRIDEEHISIDIKVENNLGDVFKIIHEFFHLKNLDKIGSSSNTKSFSEFISLYFENLAMKYFSKDEEVLPFYINYLVYNFSSSFDYESELTLLTLYDKTGNIDDNLFKMYDISFDSFFDEIIELINTNDGLIFKVIDRYPYVLGSLLSNYLIYSSEFDVSDVTNNVLNIYENIDDMNFKDILKKFGLILKGEIDNEKISSSFDNLSFYLDKLYYKKKKGK